MHMCDPLVGEACLGQLQIRRKVAEKREGAKGLFRFILCALNSRHCRQVEIGNQDAPSGWL